MSLINIKCISIKNKININKYIIKIAKFVLNATKQARKEHSNSQL